MSIWASVAWVDGQADVLVDIPERDNYTAEPVEGTTYAIDVATATWAHDGVRLCVYEGDDYAHPCKVILSATEAGELMRRLGRALERIADEDDDEDA